MSSKTKTCKGCGWVYPMSHPGERCKFCKTVFDIICCKRCGQLYTAEERITSDSLPVCPDCYRKAIHGYYTTNKEKRHATYAVRQEDLMRRVKQVPKNYHSLTESEWIEACRYFNGCAMCGSDEIDSRVLLLSPQQGGRYCSWNVVPMCHNCATHWRPVSNVFQTFDEQSKKAHYASGTTRRESLEKIIEYIGGQLDAAIMGSSSVGGADVRSPD